MCILWMENEENLNLLYIIIVLLGISLYHHAGYKWTLGSPLGPTYVKVLIRERRQSLVN